MTLKTRVRLYLKTGALALAVAGLLGLSVRSAQAHASLLRSDPPASAVLMSAPEAIRLWFTEPLEPRFSAIRLRDAQGTELDTPNAEVDQDDPMQLVLRPGDLPDGLYTVVWRVISAADGHLTQGSFPFTIGPAAGKPSEAVQTGAAVPMESAAVRWLNYLSMALALGSPAFWLFVWQPALLQSHPQIEGRMRRLFWAGWLLLGAAGVLMLLLQVSVVDGVSLFDAAVSPALPDVITGTRFGELWLVRLAAWLVLGAAVYGFGSRPGMYAAALPAGGALLLAHSLFSHASGTPDALAAVTADWLHMVTMALWIGGLAQFAAVIGPVRRAVQPSGPALSALAGHFSNYARVCVAALLLTGVYAAWLHVGSLDALLHTTYGRALLVKLALILPLLAIAAVNLLLTQRGLKAGQVIWETRLRRLVAAEVALAVGVLGAVGVMAAIVPARTDYASAQIAATPPDNFFADYRSADGMHVHLEIYPGWTGDNTFTVILMDEDANLIDDASLIRLRFTHMTENLGESELRPANLGGGIYGVEGANLSLPGEWRIRVAVQRPGFYDTVVDFIPTVEAPPPAQPVFVDASPSLRSRAVMLLLVALAGLSAGVIFTPPGVTRRSLLQGGGLVAALLMLASGIILFEGLRALNDLTPPGADAHGHSGGPDAGAPVRLAVRQRQPLPALVTADGALLEPLEGGVWRRVPLDMRVTDVYLDNQGVIWAASDSGLYRRQDGTWTQLDTLPAAQLVMTHGYLFALGSEDLVRVAAGGAHVNDRLLLHPPAAGQPAAQLVMLGNHTHVLMNGEDVYLSPDLGLSWTALEAPAPVLFIGVDAGGRLLAGTRDALLQWDWNSANWSTLMPLPGPQPLSALQVFGGRLYVAAGGSLYRRRGGEWLQVALPDFERGYITALAVRYPDTLWALDSSGARLYATVDGETWRVTPIVVSDP